ncbi:MAG: 16S rRNA (adenine(1518)-N(6)/adenine(1519)-N(6))-dimethyltransferase RsmA, partial [Actinomycetota bacterium]|nr:16S rRNA (adenine(1518)-N(6)/adenine(1519)-N(6))-dimethyltransferase RsmA [Actinomycetota bacterium]
MTAQHAALLGPVEIRALAAELGVRPTKTLGQNFVHDANTVRRIVASSDVGGADVVLEVGPGLGSLTLGLLEPAAAVVAVEIDPVLADRLPRTTAERAPTLAHKLTVLGADALQVRAEDFRSAPTALVANLPYNVAVPVLLHLFAELPTLRSALVMVQAEVADRLAAPPGSRTYGVPSVKARFYGTVTRAGAVPRGVFWPVPGV